MWNDRYSKPGFAYGESPNDFLVEVAPYLPPDGRVLCLGAGEGRNAVWLAEQGYQVTAVDLSDVGLRKAQDLAAARQVQVETIEADLATWTPEPGAWDGIVAIFAHLPPPARAHMHRAAVRGLRPGGVFVLEMYHPRQLEHRTGGPPVLAMLADQATLEAELEGLEFLVSREVEREVHEGAFHRGTSATVQVVGRKPPPL